MSADTTTLLNQVALISGFVGAIFLSFSTKVGVVSKNGSIIFDGLDPMEPAAQNANRVRASHWRNRYFTPTGWFLLAASFALQFVVTLFPR